MSDNLQLSIKDIKSKNYQRQFICHNKQCKYICHNK